MKMTDCFHKGVPIPLHFIMLPIIWEKAFPNVYYNRNDVFLAVNEWGILEFDRKGYCSHTSNEMSVYKKTRNIGTTLIQRRDFESTFTFTQCYFKPTGVIDTYFGISVPTWLFR